MYIITLMQIFLVLKKKISGILTALLSILCIKLLNAELGLSYLQFQIVLENSLLYLLLIGNQC